MCGKPDTRSPQTTGAESATLTPKTGSFGRPRRPVEERFWEKVDKSGDCWEWTAGKDNLGYGRFALHAKKRAALAHRVAYELLVGEIPEGLEIDHLCRNRGCVNPAHMEAVTHKVNVQRGDLSPQGAAARERWLSKTHCPQGHPYSGDNLMVDKNGGRSCRQCRNENYRRWYWERGGREHKRKRRLS